MMTEKEALAFVEEALATGGEGWVQCEFEPNIFVRRFGDTQLTQISVQIPGAEGSITVSPAITPQLLKVVQAIQKLVQDVPQKQNVR